MSREARLFLPAFADRATVCSGPAPQRRFFPADVKRPGILLSQQLCTLPEVPSVFSAAGQQKRSSSCDGAFFLAFSVGIEPTWGIQSRICGFSTKCASQNAQCHINNRF